MSSSKMGGVTSSRMQSVRTLNSSLPSINQSKIALQGGADALYGGHTGRSNSNIVAYNNEQDQYVVNFDELVKKNPEGSFKQSPKGITGPVSQPYLTLDRSISRRPWSSTRTISLPRTSIIFSAHDLRSSKLLTTTTCPSNTRSNSNRKSDRYLCSGRPLSNTKLPQPLSSNQ